MAPLQPDVEQALGVQKSSQPLDAGQQLADPYGANLGEPQRE